MKQQSQEDRGVVGSGAVSKDPASPLAALAVEAANELTPPPPEGPGAPPAAAEPPPPIPNSQVFAQLVGAVRDTVCMVAGLEAPKRTLTDEKVKALGELWGGVFDHYGIRLADTMGKHGPIIAAVIGSIPLIAETVIETRKEIAEKDGARPPQQLTAAPPPAPPPAVTVKSAANGAGYVEGQVKPAFPQ